MEIKKCQLFDQIWQKQLTQVILCRSSQIKNSMKTRFAPKTAKTKSKLLLYCQEITLKSKKDVFLGNLWRWEQSRTKSLKYGKSIDRFLEKVIDDQEVDFGHIWHVKRFIYYHHESKDFHGVVIFIDGMDCQCYFCAMLFQRWRASY